MDYLEKIRVFLNVDKEDNHEIFKLISLSKFNKIFDKDGKNAQARFQESLYYLFSLKAETVDTEIYEIALNVNEMLKSIVRYSEKENDYQICKSQIESTKLMLSCVDESLDKMLNTIESKGLEQ